MKKNFKKSKFVIVPALATLLLTGVASVTGTVAWFTASRTVESTIESFNTVQVTSSLNYEYIADGKSGTSLGGDKNDDKHTLVVNGDLTHGSYDAKADCSGNLYVANLNDNGVITSFDNLKSVTTTTDATNSHYVSKVDEENKTTTYTNYWLAKAAEKNVTGSRNVWYGVSWKMKFTGASQVDGKKNYLLLDAASCKFEDNKTSGEGDNKESGDTIKGLRIALMTGSKVLVIGGDGTMSHVGFGTTENTTSVLNFGAENYFDVTDTTQNTQQKVDDGDTTTWTENYKWDFGEIGTDGLTITCVAWFEGTDDNVKSEVTEKVDNTNVNRDVKLSDVETTLSFYSRTK